MVTLKREDLRNFRWPRDRFRKLLLKNLFPVVADGLCRVWENCQLQNFESLLFRQTLNKCNCKRFYQEVAVIIKNRVQPVAELHETSRKFIQKISLAVLQKRTPFCNIYATFFTCLTDLLQCFHLTFASVLLKWKYLFPRNFLDFPKSPEYSS